MLTAATLYEAVAAALSALRSHEGAGKIGKGLTEVTVGATQPEVTHTVRIKDFENWLKRQGRTPAGSRPQVLRMAELNVEIQRMGTSLRSRIVTVQADKGIEKL